MESTFLHSSTTVGDQSFNKGSSQRGKTWRVVKKVMDLGCPYLENLEESVVKEILFSDGEARFRTLQWLVGRFHPRLQELLFAPGTSTTTVHSLTSLLADMGLCSCGDHDLVKGMTSGSKQVRFLGALLDLIIVGGGEDSDLYAPCHRLSAQTDSSCAFLDQLCRSEDLDAIFPTSLSIIPPGIAKATALEVTMDGGRSIIEAKQRGNPPSSTQLAEHLKQLTQQLHSCQERLNQLSQSFTYEPLNPVAMASTEKSLLVSLETLSQLSVNFCHMYEAEIQPWTDRTMPEFNSLGASFKRVNTHREQLEKLITSIGMLQASVQSVDTLTSSPSNHNTQYLRAREAIQQFLEELCGCKQPCVE
ncbi:uncharacterized protein LOC135340363 isoform X2 [Halichondria panicea]|uniref:uncharacterized protein LOC135340363 isoform X2 n=1 Tax=Halichondria panicea TaxID=6063 RepID=UPI00312BBDC7